VLDKQIQPDEKLGKILEPEMVSVNEIIRKRMASENAPRIPEVTTHLIGAGGKRLRPILTLAAARMFNYVGDKHLKLAATVEFIHTATLLHDDVVDESLKRRGRPTANLLWDNKSSVLVGDYLFSRSFQLMVEIGSLSILDILSSASATIAEGEVLQLTVSKNIKTDEATYLKVIRGKTAALFSAATQVGGEVAGASEDACKALYEYGDALGIAFQIIDDLLDVEGSLQDTGKNSGNDFRERKVTMPFIKAIKNSSKTELEFWKKTIEKGDQNQDDWDTALMFMRKYDAIRDTHKEAQVWVNKAKLALKRLPDSEIRALLSELADYVLIRSK
jgi:octaprenyl-diphosphate synthase